MLPVFWMSFLLLAPASSFLQAGMRRDATPPAPGFFGTIRRKIDASARKADLFLVPVAQRRRDGEEEYADEVITQNYDRDEEEGEHDIAAEKDEDGGKGDPEDWAAEYWDEEEEEEADNGERQEAVNRENSDIEDEEKVGYLEEYDIDDDEYDEGDPDQEGKKVAAAPDESSGNVHIHLKTLLDKKALLFLWEQVPWEDLLARDRLSRVVEERYVTEHVLEKAAGREGYDHKGFNSGGEMVSGHGGGRSRKAAVVVTRLSNDRPDRGGTFRSGHRPPSSFHLRSSAGQPWRLRRHRRLRHHRRRQRPYSFSIACLDQQRSAGCWPPKRRRRRRRLDLAAVDRLDRSAARKRPKGTGATVRRRQTWATRVKTKRMFHW